MTILDFWAPWCQPCKQLKPMIESLEKELSDVTFEKINIDEDEERTEKYGVMSIPTLIVKDEEGNEVKRLTGDQISRTAILAAI